MAHKLPIQFLSDGKIITTNNMGIQGVMVPKDFVYDGASIPWWCWTLIGYHPFHKKVIQAATLHDYLVRVGDDGNYRDKLFKKELLRNGVPSWKAFLMWLAVRKHREINDY